MNRRPGGTAFAATAVKMARVVRILIACIKWRRNAACRLMIRGSGCCRRRRLVGVVWMRRSKRHTADGVWRRERWRVRRRHAHRAHRPHCRLVHMHRAVHRLLRRPELILAVHVRTRSRRIRLIVIVGVRRVRRIGWSKKKAIRTQLFKPASTRSRPAFYFAVFLL